MRVTAEQAKSVIEQVQQVFPGAGEFAAARALRLFVEAVNEHGPGVVAWESFLRSVEQAADDGQGWAHEILVAHFSETVSRL